MPESIEIKEKLVKLVPYLVLESYRFHAHYTRFGKMPSLIFRHGFFAVNRQVCTDQPCGRQTAGNQDRQAQSGLY